MDTLRSKLGIWFTPGSVTVRLTAALAWLCLAGATHWPSLRPTLGPSDLVQPDKIFHFTAFATLCTLVMLARPLGRARPVRWNHLIAAAAVAGYALIDESVQPWFDRVYDTGDLLANALGILGAYLVLSQPTGLTRRPGWLVNAARSIWLPIVPSAVLLALMPDAGQMVKPVVPGSLWAMIDDKDLHFWLGMAFTWLLAAAAPASRARPKLGTVLTLVIMLGAAPILEWVQGYTGRGIELADAVAHYHGLLWALAVWAGLTALVYPASPTPATPDLGARRPGAGLPQTHSPGPSLDDSLRTGVGENPEASSRFVGHAVLVSGLTLVSRLTGLFRDATLAAVFGLGAVADAFFVGFLIPNLFRRLFGEGALAAAFIPNYTDLLKADRALARRFASLCVGLLLVVLGVITLVGEAGLWWLLTGGVGWDARSLLAIRLAMIMLPYMPMVCLVALLGGLLQVHRRFGPPAAAPILLNVVMIGFAIWASLGLSTVGGDAGHSRAERVAMITAGAVLVAGLIQVGYVLVVTQRVMRLTVRLAGAWPRLRRMLIMMGPMVIGLGAFQINALLDVIIALWLSPGSESASATGPHQGMHLLGMTLNYPMRTGDIAALQWAQRLYQFPLGVFGIAIATAIFPALAAAVGVSRGKQQGLVDPPEEAHPTDQFADILRRGLRLTVFIGLPASVGLILVRLPLVRVIYERFAFSLDDAQRVAHILIGYAAAIWAYSMTHVLTRAFYALKDTATPVKVSLGMVGINFALNMTLVWWLGALGLALSTALSATVQVVLLTWLIHRRVPRPINGQVGRSWTRSAAGVGLMTIGLVPGLLFFDPAQMPWPHAAALLAAMVAVGGLIYLAAAAIMHAPELRWLMRDAN